MTTTTYENLFNALYSSYGQADTYRTKGIIDTVVASLPAATFPVLAREFAEWLVSLDESTDARQRVGMSDIVARAKFALGEPTREEIEDEVNTDRADDIRKAHITTGTTALRALARTIATLDDVRAVELRRSTGLTDMIGWAREALDSVTL